MALQNIGGTETTSGISRLTKEYLFWVIDSDSDFSGNSADVAFMEANDVKPGTTDWNTAQIVANPDNATQQAVRILVGPSGGVDLTPGVGVTNLVYSVWVRITTPDEAFVRRAGTLLVR